MVYKADANKVLVADPGLGMRKYSREEFCDGWTGHALEVIATPNLAKPEEEASPFRRFLPLVTEFRFILLEILVATLILDLMGLASPIFTQTIVDRVLVHQSLGLLNVMAIGMVVIAFFQILVSGARRYLLLHVSRKLDVKLLVIFYRHLLGLPTSYFEQRKIGDFISRF